MRINAKYSSVQRLEPFLMSPTCSVSATFLSAFTSATRLGNASTWASPYGVSPITAIVSGLFELGLIALWSPATATSGQTSTVATTARATAVRRMEVLLRSRSPRP